MSQPSLLFAQPNELSEGPVWDETTGTLLWVDILSGSLWRSRLIGSDPLATSSWTTPEAYRPSPRLAAVGLTADGGFVGALDEGIGVFAWGGPVRLLAPLPFPGAEVCFNDGKVGPDGAFWVGGKDRKHRQPLAPLLRFHPDGRGEVLARGLTISNGLDWSGKWFYLTDSIPRTIVRCSWDPATGRLGPPELFADGTEGPGVPDGLCADAEGGLWTARWGGSQVVRLSAEGSVTDRIALPVSRVSSVCLGGPDRRTLFITTAREDLTEAERRAEVLAGSVFAVRVAVPGLPAHRFGIDGRSGRR